MKEGHQYVYVPTTQTVIWVNKRRAASQTWSLNAFLERLVKSGLTVEQSVQFFKEHVQTL